MRLITLVAIPPKRAVASAIGFIKGKSAIAIARMQGKQRNFTCEHFWARGYAVSTVGFNEEQIKRYIRDREGLAVADASEQTH
jgi:putative transposase